MKSILKKSLAVVMVLSMLLTLAMPVFAVNAHADHGENDPCEHAGTDAITTRTDKATCLVPGGIFHTCSICNDTWVTDETPIDTVNGHDWSEQAQEVEATCQNNAFTAATVCKICNARVGGEELLGTQYSHDINAKNTSMVLSGENAEQVINCLNGGTYVYECKFCDYTYTNVIPAGGHNHVLKTVEYQAPTCYSRGWVTVECTNTGCDDTFKVEIAVKEHTFEYVEGKTAICYVDGYYEGYHCTNEWLVWGEDGKAVKMSCAAYYNLTLQQGSEDAPLSARPVEAEKDLGKEALKIPATNAHDLVLVNPTPEKTPDVMYGNELAYQQPMCGDNAQDGWQWWKCQAQGCDYDYKEELEPEHVEDTSFPATLVPPTCTEQGYTTRKCKICGEYYETDYTPQKHTWVSNGESNTVVYTFVKDGKIFTLAGDVAYDVQGLDVKIEYKPYMVDIAKVDTDAVSQAKIAEGYMAIAWTVMSEATCGVEGTYAHKCAKCDAKGFLTINIAHEWDGDMNNAVWAYEDCTNPGGWFANCTRQDCGKTFILSGIQANYKPGPAGEAYNGAIEPTGHLSQNGFITDKDALGNFRIPHVAAVPATCQSAGTPEFDYCNNANCPNNLESYADALAAVKDTIPAADHKYFVDANATDKYASDNVLRQHRVEPTCQHGGFYIPACETCGMPINEDAKANGGKESVVDHMIIGSLFDGVNENGHSYDLTNRGFAENMIPTCEVEGKYENLVCQNGCGKTLEGGPAAKLDPGAKPVYNKNMTNGQVIGGWRITITPATCQLDGKVEITCVYCEEHKTTTHSTEVIKELTEREQHVIAGATYKTDADGNKVKDALGNYIVIALPQQETLPQGAENKYQAGDCAYGWINDKISINVLHVGYYKCAGCDAVDWYGVRIDHTEPQGDIPCNAAVNCTVCNEQIRAAAGHVWQKTDRFIGDATDCTSTTYYVLECANCECTTENGCEECNNATDYVFDWNAAGVKTLAEYKAGNAAHDYDGMTDSTCLKDMACINTGCDHIEKQAKNHQFLDDTVAPDGNYQQPTCITRGYFIYRCAAGELCDAEYEKTIVEIGGVEYAEWRILDDQSVTANHDWQLYATTVNTAADCINFYAELYRCSTCYEQATVDADGFISNGYEVRNFADPTGHKLTEHNITENCQTGGTYWSYCDYCFDEAAFKAGKDGLWNQEDYKGEKGYTDIITKPAVGHFFYGEDGEPVYFDFTCQDAIKYRTPVVDAEGNPVLDKDGNPTYNYPACEGGCGRVLSPDDHNLSDVRYEREVTCTENGLKWHKCVVEGCDYKSILEVVLATGHDDVYWRVSKAQNCCETGTKVLACHTCKNDVAVGDMINDTLPADFDVQNVKLPYTVEDAALLTKTIAMDECSFTVQISRTEPTIHSEGEIVWGCSYNKNGHDCDKTWTETLKKEDVVELSAVIDNAVKPGHKVYVNGGKIAYTISIDADNKDIYALSFYVEYNAEHLTYTGFELPKLLDEDGNVVKDEEGNEIGANIFGTTGGNCPTRVGYQTIGANGIVSVVANVPNTDDLDAKIEDVIVDKKQVLLTLYFDINADTITDDVTDKGYATELNFANIAIINYKDEVDPTNPEMMFGSDHTPKAVNAEPIYVEKLGDVNVIKNPTTGETLFYKDGTPMSDGMVRIDDVKYIQKLILAKGYDARADIDQNGKINVLDMVAIQRYITFKHTYAEMVSK